MIHASQEFMQYPYRANLFPGILDIKAFKNTNMELQTIVSELNFDQLLVSISLSTKEVTQLKKVPKLNGRQITVTNI